MVDSSLITYTLGQETQQAGSHERPHLWVLNTVSSPREVSTYGVKEEVGSQWRTGLLGEELVIPRGMTTSKPADAPTYLPAQPCLLAAPVGAYLVSQENAIRVLLHRLPAHIQL